MLPRTRTSPEPFSRQMASSSAPIGGYISSSTRASSGCHEHVAERLVVLADGERAASNGPRVDGVDDVAAPGLGVDRLADEQETADLDVVPGLLEELSRGRRNHRLAGIDAATGDEPVRAAALLVPDEEHLRRRGRSAHPRGS